MSRLRQTRIGVILLVLGLLSVSCGVPQDGQPRPVGQDEAVYQFLRGEASATTTTTNPRLDVELGEGALFWTVRLDDETSRIEEVAVMVNVDQSTESALRALFRGPTDEDFESGYGTAIPETLTFIEVSGQEGVAVVNLASSLEGGINDLDGRRLNLALAQIVYTATASGQFDAVRILIDSEATPVPDQNGVASDEVTRESYSIVASPLAEGEPTTG